MSRMHLLAVFLVVALAVGWLTGCRAATDEPSPEDAATTDGTTTIAMYFIADGVPKRLEQVQRTIPAGVDPHKRAAELLIAGPTADEIARGLCPILPPDTRLLSSVLTGDTLVLDFSRELLVAKEFERSAEVESLALEAISLTFGQFPEIRAVRMLVEGKQDGDIDGMNVADFWGHVGLPPTIRTRRPPESELSQTAGSPVDGLKLTGARWSFDDGRLRIVFDIAGLDGSEAEAVPYTRAEMSADGQSILVFINGMRGLEAQAPRPERPLEIKSPVATSVEWLAGDEFADDQLFPLAIRLNPGEVASFQLFGLTEPTRVVLDIYQHD